MADVDKDDVTGFVVIWEIGLCYAIAKCDGGGVVDETEDVEPCDGGSVEDGATLDIWIPARDGNDDICDGNFELVGGGVAQLAEEHGYKLGCGEDTLLADMVDLDGVG